MKLIILTGLISCFLYLNIKIIISDIKNKIIPNKLLIYLLFLAPLYNYLIINNQIEYSNIIINSVITIFATFLIYYIGIWGAGDAKYILILSFFIVNIPISIFIINLSLFVILYILIYSIGKYIGKYIFDKNYREKIYYNIKNDLNIFKQKIKNKKNDSFDIIELIKFVVNFIIIFISFRIYKIHIIQNSGLLENITLDKDIKIFIIISFGILIFILFRIITSLFKNIMNTRLSMSEKESNIIIFLTILLSFALFIINEVVNNNLNQVINEIYKIITLYILIYLLFKVIFYLYKINFNINETEFKSFNSLLKDDLIDKDYLINKIGNMGTIKHYEKLGVKLNPENKKYLGNGKYKDFYDDINKKVEDEDITKIRNHFRTIKEINPSFNIPMIKVVKTFGLAGYIFGGFIITFIFGDSIKNTLVDIINFYIN